MASISTDPKGNKSIQFVGADRKRRTVRLGAVSKKVAESVKFRIECLNALAIARIPMDADLSRWVAEIGDDLAGKLAAVGLIPERPKAVTLAGLLELYGAEKEAGNKPGTRTNHKTISNDLTRFYGPNTDPKAITAADAKRFLEHLRTRGLASYTVARRIRRVRSIFAFAVRQRLVTVNPFADVKAAASLPEERKAYVPAEDVERLMGFASPVWRVIIALARFAGLRTPSETFRLKWSDANFATGRMTIPNVKTAGQTGKEYRVCPIFEKLRPFLVEARERAESGAVYVVSGEMADRIRAAMDGPNGSNDANVRTVLMKLIRRAGLEPWPRLYHTLRASCETDLLENFPMSAVTDWLGHSATIALKHYTRIPDHLYVRASGSAANSGAVVVQNPVQSGADTRGQETTKPPEVLTVEGFRRLMSSSVVSCNNDSMTLSGFEPEFWP